MVLLKENCSQRNSYLLMGMGDTKSLKIMEKEITNVPFSLLEALFYHNCQVEHTPIVENLFRSSN